MSTLSTHVLDTETGEPAAGMEIHLSVSGQQGWDELARSATDSDGRASLGDLPAGIYRIGFETGSYGSGFYPFVHVVFTLDEGRDHYHVPLLLSPYGYTTYRGS